MLGLDTESSRFYRFVLSVMLIKDFRDLPRVFSTEANRSYGFLGLGWMICGRWLEMRLVLALSKRLGMP